MDYAMSVGRVLAGVLLIAGAGFANASCTTTISDTSPDPPKTWCSSFYGVITSSSDPRSKVVTGDVSSCMPGEVCAHEGHGGEFFCCDPTQSQPCASFGNFPGHDGDVDNNLYCAPWGWERLPIVTGKVGGDGRVCKANEICALRTGECRDVCCDPSEDSKCGVPSAMCASG
jgi:hypothetical protein